jgi:hypothetical protein
LLIAGGGFDIRRACFFWRGLFLDLLKERFEKARSFDGLLYRAYWDLDG